MLFLEETFDQPASRFWPDRRVRAMVEDLLRLRREAEAGNPITLHDARRAARHFSCLAVALLSWVALRLGLRVPCPRYRRMAPEEKRRLLLRSLELGLPILQPRAWTELRFALEAANAGHTEPLLERKKGRRRRAPHIAAAAELDVLKWIRWQRGLGRTLADAEREVAAKIRFTSDAIQKWRGELPKVYGEDHVRQELELAEQVGRYERSGRDWNAINRRESDDNEKLCHAALSLERDLDLIVWMRQLAVAERVAKSRNG